MVSGNVEGFLISVRHQSEGYIISYKKDRTVGGLIRQVEDETQCSCSILRLVGESETLSSLLIW